MIARVWSGRTQAEKADAYRVYLERTGVREAGATPGNLGVLVLRRDAGAETEFVFLSFWESLDAVRSFAGPDVEGAVYYEEDEWFLLDLPPRVAHYDVPIDARTAEARA